MRWALGGLALLVAIALLLPGCGGAEEGNRKPFKVGVAAVKITPKKTGLYLAGWGENRKFTKVHDDIWARAIAFSRGDTTVVWVSLDLLGLLAPDVDAVRKLVKGVPPQNIVIACTHVHSAPDVIGLWGPEEGVCGADPDYRQFVIERTAEAIRRALRSMRIARVKFAKTQAPPRCAKNFRDEKLIDNEISIMQVVDPVGEPIATVVNWACHPECLHYKNLELTSDYVHYLRETVESKLGGTCIFFNGALGGMVSPDVGDDHSFKQAERIGRAVGNAVLAALEEAEGPLRPDLAFAARTVTIPVENEKLLAAMKAGLIQPYKGMKGREATADIAVMWLGPSVWMTMPGEPLPTVGLRAKSLATEAEYKFFISLANNELGYILPPEFWGRELYKYEMSMSLGPKTGQICLDALKELLAGAPEWARQQAGEQAEQGEPGQQGAEAASEQPERSEGGQS